MYFENSSTEIQKCLMSVASLSQELEEVRDESSRHSQYAMTMENMSNIFSIGKNLEAAQTLINDGSLLRAHIVSLESDLGFPFLLKYIRKLTFLSML